MASRTTADAPDMGDIVASNGINVKRQCITGDIAVIRLSAFAADAVCRKTSTVKSLARNKGTNVWPRLLDSFPS